MMKDKISVIRERSRFGYSFTVNDMDGLIKSSLILKASVDENTRNSISLYEKAIGVTMTYLLFPGGCVPVALSSVIITDGPKQWEFYCDVLLWRKFFKTEIGMFYKFRDILKELNSIFSTSEQELRMRLALSGV